MLSLLLVLLAAPQEWMRLEARTPAIDRMVERFDRTYRRACAILAPDVPVSVEYPDNELYIDDERAIAYTGWDPDLQTFVMRADWRMLYRVRNQPPTFDVNGTSGTPEGDVLVDLVAVHEACHLRDAEVLRAAIERFGELSPGLRMRLEWRAATCQALYMGRYLHWEGVEMTESESVTEGGQ